MPKDNKMDDKDFQEAAAKALHKETLDLAANTLTGDIRDFLLDRVKQLGKPWVAMTEDEQNDQIRAAKSAAETVVKRACEIIAAGGKKSMIGTLVKIAIKDKIQVQLDFSKHDEQRHELMNAQGLTVSVVLADAEPFTGERAPAEATPQQGSLLDKAEKLKKEDKKVTALRRKDTHGDDGSEE